MCPEKGLHLLVDAFIQLRKRGKLPDLRLKVGGGCGPSDESFVAGLKDLLARQGVADAVSFHPNLDRQGKIKFLQSLDVLSVPATYPEAFGMYLAEALAAGVPVVQPRFASFPEFIEVTGGGLLYDPDKPAALEDALEGLLLNPELARKLGDAGQKAVQEKYSAETMAQAMLQVLRSFGRER
jgi:glycosyltransferase involved in cell wall biosynthesis